MKKKYILYPAIVFLWSLLFVLLFYFNRSPIFLFIAAGINAFLVPLVYFLCIKGTGLSKFSVLYVLILGLKIASFILSKTSYAAFSLGNHILSGVIILLILVRLVALTYRVIKRYRLARKNDLLLSFPDAITIALNQSFESKKVAQIYATELITIYYCFFKWGVAEIPLSSSFSYHKKVGVTAIYSVIIFVGLIELTGTHLLLTHFGLGKIALLLTLVTAYTLIFLIGHMKAMKYKPIQLCSGYLLLNYGLIASIKVPYSKIQKIEPLRGAPVKSSQNVNLSLLKALEPSNFVVTFSAVTPVVLLFKTKDHIRSVYFKVDDTQRFIDMINNGLPLPHVPTSC